MARATKIIDKAEALHLLRDRGFTYQQMVDWYKRRHGVDTSVSMWSRFLRRNGGRRLKPRPVAIPWITSNDARNQNYAQGLRALDAAEQGEELSDQQQRLGAALRRRLVSENLVVDYDHDEEAFVLVPRRRGVDSWWIRDPFLDDAGRLVSDFSRIRLEAYRQRLPL
jgi:hypothetical protein